jgi:hypothetical protein
MPTGWKCPACHAAVSGTDVICRECGAQRPSADVRKGTDARQASQVLRDSLHRQSQSILDEIRGELSSSLLDSAASMDQPGSGLRNRAEVPADVREAATVAPQRPGPLFEKVTTRHLQVEAKFLPRLNYALVHCGLPLIHSLEIRNTSWEPALDLLIRTWVTTDFGEAWQKSVVSIPAGESHVEHNIVIPLRKSRLQEVREAEKSSLRIDIFTEGELQFSETYALEVLPYNEWYYHPSFTETIAAFVQPNSEATEIIVSLVRDRLQREFNETDLSGYQSGNPEKVVSMLEALYCVIQRDLRMSYVNPPASFEMPEALPDGGYTISQKVFFPEQVYEHRRGTCLDLALLAAGCIERMGLHPLLFLIRGHAFLGVWLEGQQLGEPVLRALDTVNQLLDSRRWLALNSTTWAVSPPRTFQDCQGEARQYLSEQAEFKCAVDIAAARTAGIKPIPPWSRIVEHAPEQ